MSKVQAKSRTGLVVYASHMHQSTEQGHQQCRCVTLQLRSAVTLCSTKQGLGAGGSSCQCISEMLAIATLPALPEVVCAGYASSANFQNKLPAEAIHKQQL